MLKHWCYNTKLIYRYTHKINGTLCATIEDIQMMIEVLQLLVDNLDMQHIWNGAQQCHLGKLAYMCTTLYITV